MGCLISCLACEAASCCARGACKCCGAVVPMSAIGGRIIYAILFFVTSFLAWIVRVPGWSEKLVGWIPKLKQFAILEACEGQESMCFGTMAVYRISASLALFHLVFALIMIGVRNHGDFRVSIQDGWWGLKLPVLALIAVGTFFLPNAVFEYYGWVALIASGFFILIQLVFLVDFAHSWAENWIGKMEDDYENEKRWFVALLGSTIGMFALSIAGTICMYVFFCGDSVKCGKNIAFVTINLLICFLISAASIHPKVQEHSPRSGLLQAALISAYSTYLIWSANMSDDESACNPFSKQSGGASNTSIIIGTVFTIIAVIYGTIRAASSLGRSAEDSETERLTSGGGDEESVDNSDKVAPDEPVTYNFSIFHLVFALGAMYIAMLMTDWVTVYHPGSKAAQIDTGLAAFYIKVITSIICCGLYGWTLVAPVILPDRQFA